MRTEADRFWPKVDRSGECWVWTACLNSRGYGVISIEGRRQLAHRVSFTWAKGPIADGLQVDHLCNVRRCVNPDHLEAVTAHVNVQRSYDRARDRQRAEWEREYRRRASAA